LFPNSNLITFYYRTYFTSTHVRGGYIQFYPKDFLKLPIREPSEKKKEDVIKLVDKMLFLNSRLSEIGDKKTDERARIEEKIKKTDAEIDMLVYEIYGITEAEQKIIENSCLKVSGRTSGTYIRPEHFEVKSEILFIQRVPRLKQPMKKMLRMKRSSCVHWNRIPARKIFIEQSSSEPKVRVMIPMCKPLETERCEKCGKVIAEPNELIRIRAR